MTAVFDTSSLVTLVLDRGGEGVDELFDNHVLDLTFYEAGNVFWKAHALQGRIDAEHLDRLLELLDRLESQLEVCAVSELDLERTMEIAVEADLTFYDAAYVACAEQEGLRLVTEDRELREGANGYLEAEVVKNL